MTIGPKMNSHNGEWRTYTPEKHVPSPRKESRLESVRDVEPEGPMRPVDGSEHAPADAVHASMAGRFDSRERMTPALEATLGAEIGAQLRVSRVLKDGVTVFAERRKRVFGYDYRVTQVLYGADALVSDVRLHKDTIEQVQQYNLLASAIRALKMQFAQWRGKADASQPRFEKGTRGWLAEIELGKLDELLKLRHNEGAAGAVDPTSLAEQLTFLNQRKEFYKQVMLEAGALSEPGTSADLIAVGSPDVGAVTREALALGYELPTAEHGALPGEYHYRHKADVADEYVLVKSNSSRLDAPTIRANVVNKKFRGLIVDGAVEVPRLSDMSYEEALVRMRRSEGFCPYAAMLERHGIASADAIDMAIQTTFGKLQLRDRPSLDTLRHEVKALFRKRVIEKLVDSTLDDVASYHQMRAIIDPLHPADYGSLGAAWYAGRYGKGGETEVTYQVTRESGDNAGKLETRRADLILDGEVYEIKYIEGKTDADKLAAMFEALGQRRKGGLDAKKARVVFLKPEGAIKNLKYLAEQMSTESTLAGMLTVEVFDKNGKQHIVSSETAAEALLADLRGMK
jgi:hypothetical protein